MQNRNEITKRCTENETQSANAIYEDIPLNESGLPAKPHSDSNLTGSKQLRCSGIIFGNDISLDEVKDVEENIDNTTDRNCFSGRTMSTESEYLIRAEHSNKFVSPKEDTSEPRGNIYDSMTSKKHFLANSSFNTYDKIATASAEKQIVAAPLIHTYSKSQKSVV